MKRLSRRTLLKGALGAAVGLPLLEAMMPSASAEGFPKRFLVFFTGLGTVRADWEPVGTESSFTLGKVLSPLAPYQDKLLVLSGIDMESAYHGPGDPHQQGIAQALTATELQEGDLFPYACNPSKFVGWGGGMSIDQMIAIAVGQSTRFPSLELGVQVQLSNVSSRISYAGPGLPVPPEDDPWKVADRLFSELSTDPTLLAARRKKRHRVLDLVKDDYDALTKKLGAGDRQRLESHLDAVSEIERRLDAPGGVLGGSCAIPDLGAPIDIYANDLYPAIGKLQLDLLAMALACDLTRVGSIQWTTVQTGKIFSWLGHTTPHHTLSHSGDTDTVSQGQLADIGHWHAEQLAYLCGKLDAIPEGGGSMLDNTVILWCTDIAAGNTHARRDMPYVLVGGAGGALSTGRYLQYSGAYHNDLLVSLAQAMDVDIGSFGNPAYCTGPLSGLTG